MVELRREAAANGPVVDAIGPGGFRIGDMRIAGGLILTPNAAMPWSADSLADIDEASLGEALALSPAPEFLLLGTGTALVRPHPALVTTIERRGIGVEVMDSRAAARAWGVLRAEGRWISAALLPL